MKKLIRPTLTLAVSFFTYLLLVISLLQITDLTYIVATWLSIPIVLIVGWLTWKSLKGEEIGVIAAIYTSSMVIGGISFVVGFLGPLILMSDPYAWPFLCIRIMGPVGLVAGAFVGFTYWQRKNKKF